MLVRVVKVPQVQVPQVQVPQVLPVPYQFALFLVVPLVEVLDQYLSEIKH